MHPGTVAFPDGHATSLPGAPATTRSADRHLHGHKPWRRRRLAAASGARPL